MQIISSKENQFIKHIRKLKDKKYRDINNEYLIEGIKLIKEAIQEKAPIKQIIICDDCEKVESIPKDLMYEIAKYECIYVTKKIFEILTNVVEPQGILAIIGKSDLKQEIIQQAVSYLIIEEKRINRNLDYAVATCLYLLLK